MTISRSLLGVAAAAITALSPTPAAAQATRVSIVVTSHKFSPAPIHLSGGVPVRLTIANQSGETHDFTAPEFFYWGKLKGPLPGGKLTLKPGQRAHITVTPRRGTYKVRCSRFAHALLGGSTTIVVH
ncbi:cupredoxin domain-containing protein [Sphingomonas mesophila]|uniref:cupredoxin domain-containing protein n=1 Tax=Sphingomonas mesophila TaxID=2303576 RepID=UPI000E57F3B1|nr:cupredoxin domain-containing protein [Sphingomonas mesophila]